MNINEQWGGWQVGRQVGRRLLAKDGYILLYSAPGDLPAPLKGCKKRRAQEATKRNRTEGSKRRNSVGKNSTFTQKKSDTPSGSRRKVKSSSKLFTPGNFKTLQGAPIGIVKVPEIPAISSPLQRMIFTPFAHEMAANMEDNGSKGGEQIIDPKSPLAVALKANFGHDDFRTKEQMQATEEIAAGEHDVLVVMSTGSGKSLTYQLGGLMQEKLAVIIAPTIALAQDQVTALMRRKLQARLLTADVCIN